MKMVISSSVSLEVIVLSFPQAAMFSNKNLNQPILQFYATCVFFSFGNREQDCENKKELYVL